MLFRLLPMAARMIWMRLARAAAKMDVDLVVMDCIGYNIGMKERFQKLSGKRVILSRTLAVRVMMELLS